MLTPNSSHIAVEASLEAMLTAYFPNTEVKSVAAEMSAFLFDEESDFLTRSQKLDSWLNLNPKMEELGDILFDLLMVQFLSAEVHEEDYFDSDEWNEIENKTLDRGSEMLNLFLYISEAKEEEVEISLDDFLNEFLLVGEDEFQDEYRIYESLIVNEDILDADMDALREIQKSVKEETYLKEYFVSLVLFFQHVEEGIPETDLNKSLSPFELAIFNTMLAYYNN
jgi:hypothetical protein